MARSGLVIEVSEAEPVVARWREQLDPQARLGVPAHVTVLFPFAPPDAIDEMTIATLHRLFAGTRPFEFALARTGWFGTEVLWLAPEPAAPFVQLTALVAEAFPAYPPYGGQFDEVVPHLTVGDHAARQELAGAERGVQARLPISATAQAVSLMVERADGRWERLVTFPFAECR